MRALSYNILPSAICLMMSWAVVLGADGVPKAVMSRRAHTFLANNCLDCHDSTLQKGRVNLEGLSSDLSKDLNTAEQWQDILNVVNSGEMPPEDEPQPRDQVKAEFLTELSYKMVIARKLHAEDGGKVIMSRLNRREYANSLEHVIGVRPVTSALPADQIEGGFDTSGASLFMSSGQFEIYQKIARQALSIATQTRSPLPKKVVRVEPEQRYNHQRILDNIAKIESDIEKNGNRGHNASKNKQLLDLFNWMLESEETKSGSAITAVIGGQGTRHVTLGAVTPHPNQEVVIRTRAASYYVDDPRFNYLEVASRDSETKVESLLGWRKVTAPISEPEIVEIPVKVEAGQALSFGVKMRSYATGSANDLGIYYGNKIVHTPPGVWVDWVEVELSEAESGYTPEMAEIMPEKPSGMSEERYATDVLKRLAQKAFRGREPDPLYLRSLVLQFDDNREQGMSLREALLDPMALVLTSPSFLYKAEVPEGKIVSQMELASRLSYFLWSSPPDEELVALAQNRQLNTPKVLEQQVARLLLDDRADHFIEGFCFQWLGMDRLGLFPFNTKKHNGFDNAVMESARQEVFESVKHVIRNDLPSKNLLGANYIVINDVLADHYELRGVEGHEFRKEFIPPGTPRGGFLGMAAILAMGSNGDESSPVERGVWILRHLLDMAPPPAPPNVPQLERLETEFVSMREKVKLHQEAPQCSQCHKFIDPVGYGLEQFDAAGRWRLNELMSQDGREREVPIKATGNLPFGDNFHDFYGLRLAVYKQSYKFAQVLVKELLSYSLGRPYQFIDEDLTVEILKRTQPEGYKLNDLITQLVLSPTFQRK